MSIKIMTYNIQSGNNLEKDRDVRHAAATIQAENPDILALNEVQHETELCADGRCQAEKLAQMLGYPYFRFGRAIDFMGGQYGNAVLSRFPILESQVFPVPSISPEEAEGCTWVEDRCHLRCVVNVEGKEIVVLTAHYGLNPPELRNAVAETARLVQDETHPLIFMGDLNAHPDNPQLKPLFDRLSDTADAGTGSLLTFPSDSPEEKIDYIFQRGFETETAYVPVSTNSDHRPFVAVLKIL